MFLVHLSSQDKSRQGFFKEYAQGSAQGGKRQRKDVELVTEMSSARQFSKRKDCEIFITSLIKDLSVRVKTGKQSTNVCKWTILLYDTSTGLLEEKNKCEEG